MRVAGIKPCLVTFSLFYYLYRVGVPRFRKGDLVNWTDDRIECRFSTA